MQNKIKVCMLSDSHGLFDDRIYWKEALSLKKHGYDITIIAIGGENEDFISDEGIRCISIERKIFFKNRLINKVYKVFSRKEFNYFIFNKAKQIEADIYHLHDLKLTKIIKKLKNLSWWPKVIYDVHEYYSDLIKQTRAVIPFSYFLNSLYSQFINRLEKKNSKYSDYIITVSPYIEKLFHSSCPNVPSAVIYNYTSIPPTLSKETKEYDAIYTGGISKIRGIFSILETAKVCREKNKEIKFLIIGTFIEKETEAKALELIEKYDLKENILIKPAVPYSEISNYYKQSKIGLGIFLPISLFQYGIQIKTFEYMAFGLPIVCSNFGSIAKYVSESNTGICVDPQNPIEISNAILHLLENEKTYNEYSSNGNLAIREKYNWQFEEKKLLEIFHDLTSKSIE